jgi:hypothetical protein
MSRQNFSLNTLSGPDSRDLSARYPADRIRVSAWFCQNLPEVPACYLGITRGRVRPFYLPVLSLYGFTKPYTNLFLIIYYLPNFKLPVLVLIWGLKQKKTKIGFPQKPTSRPASAGRVLWEKGEASIRRKKRESPVRATEDAEIPHPTVADKAQGALSPVQPSRHLSSIVVVPRG